LLFLVLAIFTDRAPAQSILACGPFTGDQIASPEPREAKWAVHRFDLINERVTTLPHRVLFFGDSLTEWFEAHAPELWRQEMASRGVLNAGVSGDRTEHLLWRLQHGNPPSPPIAGLIVLIGTNDLSYGRQPDLVAEGIRADLGFLRQRLPAARILLLGLLPREASPDAPLRQRVIEVNRLIKRCADDSAVLYADLGDRLLDANSRLIPGLFLDNLHFNQDGYARLFPRLGQLVDRIAPVR